MARIGIPMLLKVMTGRGKHVDRNLASKALPVYVPPMNTKDVRQYMFQVARHTLRLQWTCHGKMQMYCGITKTKFVNNKGN